MTEATALTVTDSSPYQLFPALDAATEAALRGSIERFGVLVPVAKDQHGNILDGYHRSRIARELGVEFRVDVHVVADDSEARAIAATLNQDRRMLARDQRVQVVQALREEGHSLRAIAGAVGVAPNTVRADLAGVQDCTPAETLGVDGKRYPARRTVVAAKTENDAVSAQTSILRLTRKYEGEVQPYRPIIQGVVNAEELKEFAPKVAPPHVSFNSGNNEWYTPAEYVDAARAVMGRIDLDPASSAAANEVVQAERFFTVEDDGLKQPWSGSVWMNPPYGRPLIDQFCAKLAEEYAAHNVNEACVLVNNATETGWFHALAEVAAAVCFPRHRIRYWQPNKATLTPLQGQAVLYLGSDVDKFSREFVNLGVIARFV